MMRMFRQMIAALAQFLVACVLMIALPAAAAELPAPSGAVVVTIAGNIQHTNRGPFDPAKDLFLKATNEGLEVQKSMEAVVAELNTIAATITPAKAAEAK